MGVDQLVESITPYNLRPIAAHLYVPPFPENRPSFHLSTFTVITSIWTYAWLTNFGYDEYYELGMVGYAVIFVLLALVLLFCHWLMPVRCFFMCSEQSDVRKSSHVCVQPTQNNGWPELVLLNRTKRDQQTKLWFEFQRVHYTWEEETGSFQTKTLDISKPMEFFQKNFGFETEDQVKEAKYLLGDNKTEMVVPQFLEMFIERATAPFFVFQVFCVGLWCLEDMWYYSLFTLFMLMTFEATLVKQQMKNMSEIRNMGNKTYMISVLRGKKWMKIKTEELVAGDIVSIGRGGEDECVPCDLLLLRGPCIVDESMLTGESVPQMKEPIEDVEKSKVFDIDNDSRLHVIFGGTKIVQHTAPGKAAEGMVKSPDGNCICYVIRTGFNTSQGKLLRTIMFGVKKATANNLETFCFILFLLIFAIAAAAYLWIKGSVDETRSKYKLFLECTLILTSVIPPELPIELSLAVNSSLMALQKLGIFCTEPFRIPFAGKVDICCFDKTGTLTTDNLVVEGVALNNQKEGMIRKVEDLPLQSLQVLASCHSLVRFDEDLVGDPLEKACLSWCDWILTKGDAVMPPKSQKGITGIKIFHRYHFSSALKRMTVVAGYQASGTADTVFISAVKGAPEVLRNMYTELPADYDETYMRLTRQGARVLAMGTRKLGETRVGELREKKRESFENDLTFAGFVVISCPLKTDTKSMIREIIDSSHAVVMITGDNPLTACHVAKVLKFTKKYSQTLVLDEPENGVDWIWKSVDGTIELPLKPKTTNKLERKAFFTSHEFCLTGSAFHNLVHNEHTFLRELILHVKVFARMAPKQKERVINELKSLGKVTLMCGDGTNDVGALKHSNVGVALLTNPYDADKAAELEKERKAKIEEAKSLVRSGATIPPRANSPGSPPPPNQSRRDAPPGARARTAPSPMNNPAQARLESLMKELEDEEKAMVIKLGDASIAAPFTSKYTSIASICHVIKQGRCTLVTTLQMFKILALNALVSAYSLSALYLDGVKFSDTQATIQGLLLAACFLFISKSKVCDQTTFPFISEFQPLKTLSRQRPMANIFNAYTLLTVTLQFIVHFSCLLYIVGLAHEADPKVGPADLEAKFTPNILNTTVYIISMALQVCTFAVNYRGRPFMESLFENKAMLYSIMFSGSAVFTLASGQATDLMNQFELVVLPEQVSSIFRIFINSRFLFQLRNALLMCVSADLVMCYLIDRGLNFFLGDMF
ncbi:Protein CBG06150 [Caenorhabditis briggsae]|uniref:Protein CBG06150 n=1 Tax=Caenorhabditis briggsae TaxID=6238 RepID=A8X0T2_CAEBR|nr:Protein CBG06150 [Caenorhabditis briggsae]CAP26242.2 Protein CBG06150 [Caenorhabditis briggsae]